MRSKLLAVAIAAGLGVTSFYASADPAPASQSSKTSQASTQNAEIEALKAQLQALQAKVVELEQRTDAQSDINVSTGQAVEQVQKTQAATNDQIKKSADKIAYKGVNITLGGFLEAATIYRSANQGADIASSYSAIPFNNVPTAHTNELRFTARQSRISALAQGDVDPQTHLAGYIELDFLGAAQTANSNESNSYNPRIRNVYMTSDWDNGGWHLLAGQNWSLVTLNSKGMLPRSELTPPQIDAQYIPGFTWTRQPQIRLVKDWNKTWWLGISLENPQTTFYTSPNQAKAPVQSVYNIAAGSGFNSANTLSLNHIPDVVVKAAVDPGFGHYEVFGLGRAFYNRYGGENHDTYGGGVGFGMVLPLIEKQLDWQFSGLSGKGIGRYGSAQMSDVTFSPNGNLAPIRENMLLTGLTWHANSDIDVYLFGGREEQDKKDFLYKGAALGLGNPAYNNSGCEVEGGTCVGNSKEIWQGTAGFWWKFYQGKFGKMQFGAQYSHTEREAFAGQGFVNGVLVNGAASPTAKENMFFTSFRYYPF
jgi:TolA-binding protein